jgi:ADP-ribosylglycohydrolase
MNCEQRSSKIRGCIFGGAIGDALGAPIEFDSYESIVRKYGSDGVVEYVEHSNGRGEFTDDTQMTLFTIEGLIRYIIRGTLRGVSSLEMVMHHAYQRWLYTQGEIVNSIYYDKISPERNGWLIKEPLLQKRRAPGLTCLAALRRDLTIDRELGSVNYKINDSKGAGGIMRVAPVGLFTYEAFSTAIQVASLTHTHPLGYLTAGFFAEIILHCFLGETINDSIQKTIQFAEKETNFDCNEIIDIIFEAIQLANEYKEGTISLTVQECIEQLGGGWVAEEALAITIFVSVVFENNFEKGVLAAINHSGDSDTTGSMVGQLLGVCLGIESIPQKWIDNLIGSSIIESISTDVVEQVYYQFSTYNTPPELNYYWERYPGW